MRMITCIAALICLVGLALPVASHAEDPPILPNLKFTPGAFLKSCTMQDICPHERAGLRGNVSASMRKAILRDYDATKYCSKPGACELDHSIPVELCGATVADNLWPESYLYSEGAHMKDWEENKLHGLVCDGEIPLKDAQEAIRKNWLAAFVKSGGPENYRPSKSAAAMKDEAEDNLYSLVRVGAITPQDARKAIATDWVAVYAKYAK